MYGDGKGRSPEIGIQDSRNMEKIGRKIKILDRDEL